MTNCTNLTTDTVNLEPQLFRSFKTPTDDKNFYVYEAKDSDEYFCYLQNVAYALDIPYTAIEKVLSSNDFKIFRVVEEHDDYCRFKNLGGILDKLITFLSPRNAEKAADVATFRDWVGYEVRPQIYSAQYNILRVLRNYFARQNYEVSFAGLDAPVDLLMKVPDSQYVKVKVVENCDHVFLKDDEIVELQTFTDGLKCATVNLIIVDVSDGAIFSINVKHLRNIVGQKYPIYLGELDSQDLKVIRENFMGEILWSLDGEAAEEMEPERINFDAAFEKLLKISSLYNSADNLSPEDVGRFKVDLKKYFKAEMQELIRQLAKADWK